MEKKKSNKSSKKKKKTAIKKKIAKRSKKVTKKAIKKSNKKLTVSNKKNPSKKVVDKKEITSSIKGFTKKGLDILKNVKINLKKEVRKKKLEISKEKCIILFSIIVLVIFNLSLYASTIIYYEVYNSVEFLSIVFLNPFVLILMGLIYGIKYGFSWLFPTILTCCFIPSIFIFLNVSFVFYLPIYFIFVLAAELCGISVIKISKG